MKRFLPLIVALSVPLTFSIATTLPVFADGSKKCSPHKVKKLLERATPKNNRIHLDCSVTLPKNSMITKLVYFIGARSSNVTLNCNGGRIDGRPRRDEHAVLIVSNKVKGQQNLWSRPENITINQCIIVGALHVRGMGKNGEAQQVRVSSYQENHTQRVQSTAPRAITVKNTAINGTGTIPIYLAPGVTEFRLLSSRIGGMSRSVAIYFDAESAHNLIERSQISVDAKREQLAIDGSAYNQIINNRFSNLRSGGIYLYRNCGEGGTVRHQAPRYNTIAGNTFYYDKFKGRRVTARGFVSNKKFRVPSIWLGSRQNRPYCEHDRGYPFGSSVNNGNFADFNRVIDNRIVKLRPSLMIINNGQRNEIAGNRTVAR